MIISNDEPRLCNSSISTNKTHSNIGQKVGVSESSTITKNKDKKPKPNNANEGQQLTNLAMIDTRHNEQNEVVKYQFFQELAECGINDKDPRDPKTILQYINAIHELEIATKFKDFKSYDLNFALEFKDHLANKISKKTGKNISKSLYVHYLKYNKEFLEWLKKEKKKYSKLNQKDINYLKTNKNQ